MKGELKSLPPAPPPPKEFTVTMSDAEALAIAKLGGNIYQSKHGEGFGHFLDEPTRKNIGYASHRLPAVREETVAEVLNDFYHAYLNALMEKK